MSLHLPPISRRRFIAVSIAAGVPVLRCGARSADPEERMALLSDTHIAADSDKVLRGAHLVKNLERVVQEVLEVHRKTPLSGTMINGDCALTDGQPGDYATLHRVLRPLSEAGQPAHLTMGNHDHRANALETFSNLLPKPPVDGKHLAVVESRFANWFYLDSLMEVNVVTGELGEAQLEWLSAALEARKDVPAILVGHHTLQGDMNAKKIGGLKDTPAFRKLLKAHPQVVAYIFGHSHNWKVTTDNDLGVHLINLPPTSYVFDGSRPNGWVQATLSEKGILLKLHALDKTHKEHGQEKQLAWGFQRLVPVQ